MDRIDRKLLELLQENADRPINDLAEAVHLTPTPCWKRIQKLQQTGIIQRKVVLCDPVKMNLGLTAFVAVRTTQHSESSGASSPNGGFNAQSHRLPRLSE